MSGSISKMLFVISWMTTEFVAEMAVGDVIASMTARSMSCLVVCYANNELRNNSRQRCRP
jgi:hypothetical protein